MGHGGQHSVYSRKEEKERGSEWGCFEFFLSHLKYKIKTLFQSLNNFYTLYSLLVACENVLFLSCSVIFIQHKSPSSSPLNCGFLSCGLKGVILG